MPASPVLNRPMPTGAVHRRRYHYISERIEGCDPDALAEAANRRAGQGYALFSTIPVPRGDRTDVVLVFARRLRRAKGAAEAVEGVPPVDDTGRPILTSSEEGHP